MARLFSVLDAEGYDVERELGQGQFGKVVLAKSRADGSLVAVKAVAESFSSANERSMIGRPAHPNVLQTFKSIHDPKLDINVCFLEYCNGGDLQMWLDRENRPLNYNELLVFTTQVASGLQFLHSQNIAHRDIKPSNVLLHIVEGWTTYKLGDFGTAREKTMMETVAGTPFFMAPEIEAGGYGKEIDLWSLGCTIFYCCALRQLFEARNRPELRDMVSRPLTPERVRERLAAAGPRCPLNEVERERMAFAVSALVQIIPGHRIAVADLLQQFQPIARVTDVRKGEEHTVPISLAVRPTVSNITVQIADVFGRAPENLYLHDRRGELTDARLAGLLWTGAPLEVRLTDIEAYLSSSLGSPEETEFEVVEAQDSPDAAHALATLPALAHASDVRLRARLPELEAAASLRDSVARELALAEAAIDKVYMAKALLAGIEGIPEDEETLAVIHTLEQHINAAEGVITDSAAFFVSIDSPIITLARTLATLQLPPGPTVHDLPQLVHKHLTEVSGQADKASAAQRAVLRELLQKHASLTALFAPHGAVTRAKQALHRYRKHIEGLVDLTARTQAQRAIPAATAEQLAAAAAADLEAARLDSEAARADLEAAQAELAAAATQAKADKDRLSAELARMSQERLEAISSAQYEQAREALSTAQTLLQEAQAALEAREAEVGIAAGSSSFAARLAAVLEQFYHRSLSEAEAGAALKLIPVQQMNAQLIGQLSTTQTTLEATQTALGQARAALDQATARTHQLEETMQVTQAHSAQVESEAGAVQQTIAEFKSKIEQAHARIEELENQSAELATTVSDKDRTLVALRERLDTFELQTRDQQARAQAQQSAIAAATAEIQSQAQKIAEQRETIQSLEAERAALTTQLGGMQLGLAAREKERNEQRRAAETADARVKQLEAAMREYATQFQNALKTKDQHIAVLQAENHRLTTMAMGLSTTPAVPQSTTTPAVPQFTPPRPAAATQAAAPQSVSPGPELAAARAEIATLKGNVQKMASQLREADAEHERLRGLVVQLRQEVDLLQGQQLGGLSESVHADVMGSLERENRELGQALRAAREEMDVMKAGLAQEQDARGIVEQEMRGLQDHVRQLAEENEMLCQRGGDGLGDLIVATARALYPGLNELRDLEACVAQLRRTIARKGDLTLLAMNNVQYGDRVLILGESRVLQHPGAPAVTVNPDSGVVPPYTTCTVLLFDEGTVHVATN